MKHLAFAAFGGVLSAFTWSAAAACEIVHVYQYQMQGGAYAMSLNGVHLSQNDDPGDYFGGGPFMQWLSEGENTFAITMNAGSADIKVQRACQGDFDGDTLVETTVTAPETKELTFFVENAPKPVYDDVATDDAGLKEALAALKTAIDTRDFDTYWSMHKGLLATATAAGMPEEMMRMMMTATVEQGKPTYNDNVSVSSALDGRVWLVFAEGGESPIVIDIEMNGGTNTMRTGAYWAKVDGEWSAVGN